MSQHQPVPVTQVSAPVTVSEQQAAPVTQAFAPVTMSQQQPVPVTQVSVTVSQQQPVTVTEVSTLVTMAQQQLFHPQGGNVMVGKTITGLTDVLQWSFPSDFCQSAIAGRYGSNACTFIALYFGYLYLQDNLLTTTWQFSLNGVEVRIVQSNEKRK